MNKLIKISFLILTSLMLCTCSSDNEELTARYYVKYEVQAYTYHKNVPKKITFITDKGKETIELNDAKTHNWEGTYGPVSKGFEAQIIGELTRDYNYEREFHARIYVCRDKEPFVIKAEGTGTSVNLTYEIDF